MKVSIIIAVYNIEKYIEKCLVSVLNQTFSDIEIIVVNDGSTDSSLDIIKKICVHDKRVKIINQNNKGLIEARKSGFRESEGEYILFMDGDDWLELNAIEILYAEAIQKKSDIVLFNAYNSYDDGSRTDFKTVNSDYFNEVLNDPLKHLFLDNVLPVIWAKFIKRKFIVENNIDFPNNISYGEDLAFVSKLFMNKPNITLIDDKLYNYFQRIGSISRSTGEKILEVDKALSFIEEELKIKGIKDEYKEEFDKLVYRHLLLSKILRIDEIYAHRKDVYKQYKRRKVNINKNKYIKVELQYGNRNLRIRTKLYNYSYYLGSFYDCIRKVSLRRI